MVNINSKGAQKKQLLSFSSLKHLQNYLTVSPWHLPTWCFPTGKGLFWHWKGGALKTELGWVGWEVCGAGPSPSWGRTSCKAEADQRHRERLLHTRPYQTCISLSLHDQAEEGEKWDCKMLSVCVWKLSQICPEQKPIPGNRAEQPSSRCLQDELYEPQPEPCWVWDLVVQSTGKHKTGDGWACFTKTRTVLKLCSSFTFNPKRQFSSRKLHEAWGHLPPCPVTLRALSCSHSRVWMRCFASQNQLFLARFQEDARAARSAPARSAPSPPQALCLGSSGAVPKPSRGSLGQYHTVDKQCSSRQLALKAGKAEGKVEEV